MSWAAIIMAGVSATAGLAGLIIVARPARSPQMVYARRIAGTMTLAFALMLAIFAYGLTVLGG